MANSAKSLTLSLIHIFTFEQLGVDRLFVDESHAFKNLFLYTKMRNVAGLSTSEAQKSSDMFMKCRYMDEKMCIRDRAQSRGCAKHSYR